MRPATLVRPLSATESQALHAGLHSRDAFTLRRCQILLASARGHSAAAIADIIGCTPQAVYKAIWTFQAEGLSSLTKKSNGPEHPRRA